MPATGTLDTRLIVLRGNSGAGKSTIAAGLRARYGRGLAIVGHDAVRREMLWERERPGGAAPGLIDAIARHTLDAGRHTVVEGILGADLYGQMLTALAADHRGTTCLIYLDVPWEETLRRHATRGKAAEFGADEMRAWFRSRDLLPDGGECVIGERYTAEEAADWVFSFASLTRRAPGGSEPVVEGIAKARPMNYRSVYSDRLRKEGREKGIEEGSVTARSIVLSIAKHRGLVLDNSQRARVEGCSDLTTLQCWADRALDATSAADIFA